MKLEPFDILLIIKTGLIGKVIGEVTDSIYSHAALVLDYNHIIDVAFYMPVKIRHINYKLGEFDAFRLNIPLSEKQKEEIIEFYQKALNSKYDFLEFFSVGVKRLSAFENHKKYICSTLVYDAFESAGIRLVEKNGIVTPADLSGSSFLTKVNDSEFSGEARVQEWRP